MTGYEPVLLLSAACLGASSVLVTFAYALAKCTRRDAEKVARGNDVWLRAARLMLANRPADAVELLEREKSKIEVA